MEAFGPGKASSTEASGQLVVPVLQLARKVPPVKKTGNSVFDNKLDIDREHLVQGINLLWAFPRFR
eukprot:4485046-Prorocentrum_lima.AAC.1